MNNAYFQPKETADYEVPTFKECTQVGREKAIQYGYTPNGIRFILATVPRFGCYQIKREDHREVPSGLKGNWSDRDGRVALTHFLNAQWDVNDEAVEKQAKRKSVRKAKAESKVEDEQVTTPEASEETQSKTETTEE
jgi:hypothetical protein